MWDMSRSPSPTSKHRRVTAAEREQQARVAETARRETTAMLAGTPIPSKPRRRQARNDGRRTMPISPAQADQLWGFLGAYGNEIAAVLALARSETDQLAIAQAYQAVKDGKPAAHAAWHDLVRLFSV
jgi:hypothetical protein